MKLNTLLFLPLIVCLTFIGCNKTPRNISDMPDAKVSYTINDRVTNDEYQVVTVTTVPNKEYKIKTPDGKTHKIIDNVPVAMSGVADMNGNIIVPLEYNHIYKIANGYIQVQMHSRPEHYHYNGIYYKDGTAVVPCEYHSLDMDDEGRGAMATISNPDGRTQQIYTFDFEDGNKKTLLPFNDLSAGLRDGKIHIRSHRNPENLFKDYYFDFSGQEITD